jgi:UDP-N-acetylglucosamine:LPS N-acetylglucosamine transferase
MMPEWMGSEDDGKYSIKDNGIWLLNNTAIPDYIAQFLDEWFTDTLNPETYTVMSEMANKYNKQNFERQTVETLEKLVASRIQKLEEINKTINE